MKKKVWITAASIAAVIAVAAIAGICFLLPYLRAKSDMPTDKNMTVYQLEDGTLKLEFPAADKASFYLAEIFEPIEENEGEEKQEPVMLYSEKIDGTSFILPELPQDRELTVRITSAVEYGTPLEKEVRYGDTSLEVTTVFDAPKVSKLEWSADDVNKTVSLSFDMDKDDKCVVVGIDANGNSTQLRTLENGSTELKFGDGGDMPIPEYDETYTITLAAYRNPDGLDFYGYTSAEFSLIREDFLGRDLALQISDDGNNVFSLTWQETKGEYYKVQVTNDYTEDWETVCEISRDGELKYQTPHLEPFQNYEYRVLAVGGQVMSGKKVAAESEELSVSTKESPIYCTIWPVKDLEAYSDTAKTETVGTAATGEAYCVLDEKDGMFAISLGGKTVYIDSTFCMINLPEYIGDLCIYKITNSYSSIYLVHEYEIPDVTGVVTKGYGYVRQYDGSYLVPLLYRTAQKLVNAAQNAIERGYKLKIYDAYRPYVATRSIYDLTAEILDDPIPEETYTGKTVDLSALDVPEKEEKEEDKNEDGTDKEPEEPEITYELLMTNNTYSLGHFLARVGSTHNQGVALDLTLVDLATGYEVSMQTSIHDLSWYSVLYRNNSSADVLADIMKSADFGDLVSEWWHFQDDDARNTLELPYVTNGINAECWVADDFGWKYRDADGAYYTDTTITVGETEYTFDADGYVVE